jgi:hypothetical protein
MVIEYGHRRVDCVVDGACDPGGRRSRIRRIADDDNEFVAPEACHRIAYSFGRIRNSLRAGGNRRVADRMTVGVVELLEVVQVDGKKGKSLARPSRAFDRLPRPVLKQVAVGKACQGIVGRQILDLRLVRLALRHVLARDEHAHLSVAENMVDPEREPTAPGWAIALVFPLPLRGVSGNDPAHKRHHLRCVAVAPPGGRIVGGQEVRAFACRR